MHGSAIQELKKIIGEGLGLVEVNGKQYTFGDLSVVADRREIKPVEVRTLTGLVDYISSGPDEPEKITPSSFMLVVHSPFEVSLVTALDPDSKMRQHVITASYSNDVDFSYGRFLDHEDFIIRIQSQFEDTADRAKLMRYVSRLRSDSAVETEDDGITQRTTVAKGVSGALVESAQMPSIVELAPFRTFHEIKQPASKFLFRLREQSRGCPECALFEADGGAWKNQAMLDIKAYLNEKLSDLTVVA